MQRILRSRFLAVYLGYGVIVGFLAVGWRWQLLLWVLGYALGLGLTWADKLVYVYYLKPHEHLSMHVKLLLSQKRWRDALIVLWYRQSEQVMLMGRSVLFLVIYLPVVLYVMTSSGSIVATGMVMGMGVVLAYEMIDEWKQPELLRKRVFWQIKRRLSVREMKVVVGLWLLVFGGMTSLLVF